jgi:thiamine biosynthesis lipoprotein
MTQSANNHPNRRDFLALGVGALAVSAVPLLRRRDQVIRRTIPVMGTMAEITVVHPDRSWGHRAVDAAAERLQYLHRTLTRYETTSDVGRVNGAAGRGPVTVAPSTVAVVDASLRWARATEGRFDPALGRVVDLWDVTEASGPPPSGEWGRFARAGLFRLVETGRDGGAPAIQLLDSTVALDLGGIGKGYGVDLAVDALRDWGITSGLVNVGGDLYALGPSPDGNPWTVGVRDPDSTDGVLTTLAAEDQAIATSGDYVRYFQHRGQRYHHLLDPDTGAPRETEARSVTVTAATCLAADAGATVAFGLSDAEAASRMGVADPSARVVHSA